MLGVLYNLAGPALRALDPERAHDLTVKSLAAGLLPSTRAHDDPRLGISLWGLEFANPVGIAAGFDKDARVPDAMLKLGFGHAEVGTVTPQPQSGNPRPRLFRLKGDRALVNRLGFNNAGHGPAFERLRQRAGRPGIVGVNVGANRDAADRAADYVAGVCRFWDVASYLTVNISSPNTPGLRDLQAPAALDDLLSRVMAAREERLAAGRPRRPLVVKLAPDIAEDDLEPIVRVLTARGVDGIAISNTTLARPGLTDPRAAEAGGLSGRPLFHRSTVMLARVYRLTGGRVPLIGIGGIDSGAAAVAKIEAGATLLQLYTGLVYRGPRLLTEIRHELAAYARLLRFDTIAQAVGRKAEAWASQPLDG